MKYPLNIPAWVEAFRIAYPDNNYGAVILEHMLPMVNEAYEQGLKDGRKEATA